jgi:hypothetical protein
MPRLALALALLATGATTQAAASWLYCTATGTDGTGAIAYNTTIANVGAVPTPRMAHFQQRLLAHVTQADPDARGLHADCFAFDDQLAATAHYSRSLDGVARRLGWDHVTVLTPETWLADTDIVDDPSRP